MPHFPQDRFAVFPLGSQCGDGFPQDCRRTCPWLSGRLFFRIQEFQRVDHNLRAVNLLAVPFIIVVLAPARDKEFCPFGAVLFNDLSQPVPAGAPEKVGGVIALFIPFHVRVGNRKIEYCMCHRFAACTVSDLGIFCQPSH